MILGLKEESLFDEVLEGLATAVDVRDSEVAHRACENTWYDRLPSPDVQALL